MSDNDIITSEIRIRTQLRIQFPMIAVVLDDEGNETDYAKTDCGWLRWHHEREDWIFQYFWDQFWPEGYAFEDIGKYNYQHVGLRLEERDELR